MTREEAIRRIKAWNLDSDDMEVLAVIIPELKENEDERIRKILLKMAKVPRKEIYEHEGITKEQAISYLEKQKELDKMIVVSPEVWDKAIADAYENGKKDNEKQKENPEEPKIAFGDWGDKEKQEAIFTCLKYMRFIKKITNQEYNDLVKWLEDSLNEQKPAEWSDAKELVFKDICKHLKEEGYGGWVMILNALRNGEFQPKPEWSEEDEKRIKQLIYDTEAIRVGYEKRKELLGDAFNDEQYNEVLRRFKEARK